MITQEAENLAKAIHRVLKEDTLIQTALGEEPRLYDDAPEDPVFPYLTYGAMRSTDIGADETPLSVHQITLHLWSRYAGRAEVLSLITHIHLALTAEHLSATEFVNVRRANIIFSDILRAPDGLTRHGVLRMSFVTEGGAL